MARPPGEGAPDWPWLTWQILDSAFPSGGFAHSSGLEAAWHHGEIPTLDDLREFISVSLRQTGLASIPFANVAHSEPDRLGEFDALCDAWISNHVANRASRIQGRAFWTAAARAFLGDDSRAPEPGHLAPVFGALLGNLRVTSEQMRRVFLFLHLRGLVSAAVRLGIVGPLEAQSLQHQLASVAELTAVASAELTLEDLAQTTPLIDLWQMSHDRLYSRLFQS